MSLDGTTDTEIIEAEPKTDLLPEVKADDKLVKDAYEKVQAVFIEAISNSMDELGDYFFSTFFGNDIDRVRKKQPVKDKSFLSLIKMLQDTEVDTPSKSWLYNAVNIAADKAYFEGEKLAAYSKLSVTQRVYIARINDLVKKKILIIETVENNYSVRALKEQIDGMIKRRATLNLERLDTDENMEKLRTKSQERLASIVKTIEGKMKSLNQKQIQIDNKQKAYKLSKDVASKILEEVKKASKKKKVE